MQRITNFTDKTLPIVLQGETFNELVRIVGNVVVYIGDCAFNGGLHITSDYGKLPKKIEIANSYFPVMGNAYPLKISATKTPGKLIEHVEVVNCLVSGNGLPYRKSPSPTLLSGTPDNIAIHNCDTIVLSNVVSKKGGENGFSLNASKQIILNDCMAFGNDGQGLHIGDHDTMQVVSASVSNFRSIGNMLNKLNTPGKSVGVLLHNTKFANIQNLESFGNEFAVSHQLRGDDIGELHVSGVAYGVKNQNIPILRSSNVVGITDLKLEV